MKKKIKKALILPLAIISLFAASCSKDNAVSKETQEKAQIEALKQFLAEKMHLDPSSIEFDQEKKVFILPAEPGEYAFEFGYESVLDVYTRDKNQ